MLPVSHGERLGDVIDVVDEAASEGDGLRRVPLVRRAWRLEPRDTGSQSLVYELFQAASTALARALEQLRDVIVECQGSPHAPKHKALMP